MLFNQAAETYDNNCLLQKKTCINLISHLKKIGSKFQNIVDFGCGTGISTHLLYEHIEHDYLCGVDFAPKLLDKAKIKLNTCDVDFHYADFNEVVFPNNTIDLAFSNMAFQWSIDLNKTLATVATQLKDNAILAFSLPISGTLSEIHDHHKNNFHEIIDISNALNTTRFTLLTIKCKKAIRHFSTPIAALKSIKLVGANSLTASNQKRGLSTIKSIFKQNSDDPCLTYNIAYILAKKASSS